MQIGLGSNVASITAAITTSGASQRTDNPFDIMINGDGFFIVNSGGANYFTKAGSFNVDADGTLCTPSGAKVMGWQVDPDDPTKTIAAKVSALDIMAPKNLYADPEATTAAYISGNIDNKDTQIASDTGKMVNLQFYDNMGHLYTADMKVKQVTDTTNQYTVAITDIKDETGQSVFVKKVVDEDGNVSYTGTSITSFTLGGESFSVDGPDETTGAFTIDSSNAPILTFNASTGKFVSVGDDTDPDSDNTSINFKVSTSDADADPFKEISIDFSSITMYATSGSSSLEGNRGDLDGNGKGKEKGNMAGISIDQAGKIYGKYDNGDSKLLGQIAIATFANPAGLEAIGNSMFAATQNSGDFDGIGQDPTLGGDSLTTGVLEMSNVDLSQEFTNMITTQRGFQANSRIITTSDTLLEELINLKR